MLNQSKEEILKLFETLQDVEEKLFYASNYDTQNEDLKNAHKAANQALELYAKATGCHN